MAAGWTNFSVGGGTHPGDDDGPVAIGEDTPACASCKKRKLRCSRETPTCSHCVRLSTECVYNPKLKPGLKPGAVEALTRRVAVLERILLDEDGNVRTQFEAGSERTGDRAPSSGTPSQVPVKHSVASLPPVSEQKVSTPSPLKRKFSQTFDQGFFSAVDDADIAAQLPSQPLLVNVVDFFCISFHHWIPYLHKARLQALVREGSQQPSLALVLHALVAVCIRHMDPGLLFLDDDQIRQQIKVSRTIVETRAIQSATVESLQALIFLVFEHLNDGEPHKAWPLIGLLTRTIDYLQLTTEPYASPTTSLMRPVRLVAPSNDWTELEMRRRLFWNIFLLDRYCSVSTGWNTSLTADDVSRRLPSDGGYFTREEPVTTPYFGIWQKSAARIGRSLAHVPAQYNDDDPAIEQPQGASPSSASGYIDASKLGAFAYCVEATESLSQVTTFFLQQRINWQDKDHAVGWLTRFKELDLRLVHWKMFLPPRWKDSNISADRRVIDMDPNLTLAHLTHNTSMILLHHPIAYPPRSWNDYVALPRECSAQTCGLAAVESSNIVCKFLKYTPIPFVNVQFAFCAFVAAKALLFEHQVSKKPLQPHFNRLTRDLREMSIRWTTKPADVPSPDKPLNQAGVYAMHLENLHEAGEKDTRFRFDFYDHTCRSLESTQALDSSPAYSATPGQTHAQPPYSFDRPAKIPRARQNSQDTAQSILSPHRRPSSTGTGASTFPSTTPSLPTPTHMNVEAQQQQQPLHAPRLPHTPTFPPPHNQSPIYHQSSNPLPPPSPFHPLSRSAPPQQPQQRQQQQQQQQQQQASHVHPPLPPPAHTHHGHQHNASLQDQNLINLSDAFTDSHFLDMDRVITFEDANFVLPGDAFKWG